MANPLYLIAAGVSAFGMLYSGKAAKAQAKQQAYELKIQEQNEILNSVMEENAIVNENQKVIEQNLAVMQGGESSLVATDEIIKKQKQDVQVTQTKSLLKRDALIRGGKAALQAGKMSQRASYIGAAGSLIGGGAKYKDSLE